MLNTHELQYLKTPRMSTSLTAALTIGTVTVGGPSPTRHTTPPDFVACKYQIKKVYNMGGDSLADTPPLLI